MRLPSRSHFCHSTGGFFNFYIFRYLNHYLSMNTFFLHFFIRASFALCVCSWLYVRTRIFNELRRSGNFKECILNSERLFCITLKSLSLFIHCYYMFIFVFFSSNYSLKVCSHAIRCYQENDVQIFARHVQYKRFHLLVMRNITRFFIFIFTYIFLRHFISNARMLYKMYTRK